MRRALAFAFALMVPLTWAVVSNGCGGGDSDPPVEDACGFLAQDGNCAEQFQGAVQNACGAPGAGNAPKGSFLMRAKLDQCFLAPPLGGVVVFDPPLDPTMFPPDPVGFKILLFNGSECANGSVSNGGATFSINVDPFPPDGGTGFGGAGSGGATASSTTGATSTTATATSSASATSTGAGGAGGAGTGGAGMGGAGGAGTGGAGTGGAGMGGAGTGGATSTSAATTGAGAGGPQTLPTNTEGGSLGISQAPGRRVFDLSCGTETHHFDRYQLGESACTFGSLIPTAILQTDPGGIDREGYVRFSISYEPDHATASSMPVVVSYFDCAIPAAPEPCFDGAQDGAETDIDCGGNPNLCITRCPDGAKCVSAADCVTPACTYKMGFKTCGNM